MLRTVAIDDEPMAVEVIRKFASKVPFLDLTASFNRVSGARDYLQKNPVDLLFLDIRMPDMSGIEFLRSLPDPPMVIFTTAFSNHAVESFELDAIDFLLKPFSYERFLKACQKAERQYTLRKGLGDALLGPPAIYVKDGYDQVRLILADILYVEASGNYVHFVLSDRRVISRMSLAEAERLLPPPAFLRVHRSYLVAIRHIARVEKNIIRVGNTNLPVATASMNAIQKAITRPSDSLPD